MSRRAKKEHFQEYLGSGIDPPGFEVVKINDYIGYGVFAQKSFKKGDFLLEYAGDRITESEAVIREKNYKEKEGCYIFYGIVGINGRFCIDATYSHQMARYVNDSPMEFSNSVMKRHIDNGLIFLVLFAFTDIKAGTEIRYDYGDTPTEMEWRDQTMNLEPLMRIPKSDKTNNKLEKNENKIYIKRIDPTISSLNELARCTLRENKCIMKILLKKENAIQLIVEKADPPAKIRPAKTDHTKNPKQRLKMKRRDHTDKNKGNVPKINIENELALHNLQKNDTIKFIFGKGKSSQSFMQKNLQPDESDDFVPEKYSKMFPRKHTVDATREEHKLWLLKNKAKLTKKNRKVKKTLIRKKMSVAGQDNIKSCFEIVKRKWHDCSRTSIDFSCNELLNIPPKSKCFNQQRKGNMITGLQLEPSITCGEFEEKQSVNQISPSDSTKKQCDNKLDKQCKPIESCIASQRFKEQFEDVIYERIESAETTSQLVSVSPSIVSKERCEDFVGLQNKFKTNRLVNNREISSSPILFEEHHIFKDFSGGQYFSARGNLQNNRERINPLTSTLLVNKCDMGISPSPILFDEHLKCTSQRKNPLSSTFVVRECEDIVKTKMFRSLSSINEDQLEDSTTSSNSQRIQSLSTIFDEEQDIEDNVGLRCKGKTNNFISPTISSLSTLIDEKTTNFEELQTKPTPNQCSRERIKSSSSTIVNKKQHKHIIELEKQLKTNCHSGQRISSTQKETENFTKRHRIDSSFSTIVNKEQHKNLFEPKTKTKAKIKPLSSTLIHEIETESKEIHDKPSVHRKSKKKRKTSIDLADFDKDQFREFIKQESEEKSSKPIKRKKKKKRKTSESLTAFEKGHPENFIESYSKDKSNKPSSHRKKNKKRKTSKTLDIEQPNHMKNNSKTISSQSHVSVKSSSVPCNSLCTTPTVERSVNSLTKTSYCSTVKTSSKKPPLSKLSKNELWQMLYDL